MGGRKRLCINAPPLIERIILPNIYLSMVSADRLCVRCVMVFFWNAVPSRWRGRWLGPLLYKLMAEHDQSAIDGSGLQGFQWYPEVLVEAI